MIPGCALTPRNWELLDSEVTQITDDTRANIALRYGIGKLLTIPENHQDALAVAQQVSSSQMRSIFFRTIANSMLVDDMQDAALSVIENIENIDIRDDGYSDYVLDSIASNNLDEALECALKITHASKREFALMCCRSSYYAFGQADVGAGIWRKFFGSYDDMPIPKYLYDLQPQRLVGTSFQPENFVIIRLRDPEKTFRKIVKFYRVAESSPEKDRFLGFAAWASCLSDPTKSVLVASMIEDITERDHTLLRMASAFCVLDAENPVAKSFCLLVPDLACQMTDPQLKSEALMHSVKKLKSLGLIPQALAIAAEIPNLELRYSVMAKCKEARRSAFWSLSTFFAPTVSATTILSLDANVYTTLLPKSRHYKALATCMQRLAKDDQDTAVKKMAFTVNTNAQETFRPDDYIDPVQKQKRLLLREALANDDDRATLMLLEEEVKAIIPYTKLSKLFSLSLELGLKKAALMLVKRGAQVPQNRKNELLAWAKEHDLITPILLLIEDGAEIPLSQEEYVAYMHLAVLCRRNKACAILLSKIKNIHAQDEDSNTFLHNACKRSLYETVELLVARGALPHLANDRGRTPMQIAEKYQNIILIKLLQGMKLDAIYDEME